MPHCYVAVCDKKVRWHREYPSTAGGGESYSCDHHVPLWQRGWEETDASEPDDDDHPAG